jgi:hypothetical protein
MVAKKSDLPLELLVVIVDFRNISALRNRHSMWQHVDKLVLNKVRVFIEKSSCIRSASPITSELGIGFLIGVDYTYIIEVSGLSALFFNIYMYCLSKG